MTKYVFYLVRHGETFLNTLGRFQGWIDSELTAKGKSQASRLGATLRDERFDLVVASDLPRTVKTRDLILAELKHYPADVRTMAAFREIFFSTYEGTPVAESIHKITAPYGYRDQEDVVAHEGLRAMRQYMHEQDPAHAAELYPALVERFNSGLTKLTHQLPNGGRVLVVSHGSIIRTIADYLGVNNVNNAPTNGSVTKLVLDQSGQMTIMEYNRKLEL